MTTCKNCDRVFEGNFCNQCGQSAKTHPMNFHFLWHDIQHGLFHFDKGVPYTLKALFTRPGHAIRAYIEGKRVQFFKPISLLILVASFYALLTLYFNIKWETSIKFSDDPKQLQIMSQVQDWINQHYVGYTLLTLPFWTLGTYISFFKQRYNLIEHFVLNTYITVQMVAIQILLFPITLYYKRTPHFETVIFAISLIYIVISVWTYTQFFNKLSKTKAILYSLLAYLIMLTATSILGAMVGIALSLLKVL